jgi:small subunit ribosomal protein S1
VLEVKDEGRSVIVSRRALLEKERRQTGQAIVAQLAVGSEYQGKVASLQKYGAFIELGGGVEGLVHISEISHTRTDRVEDILSVGEVVNVKVLAIDPSDKGPYPRLRLSMKALTEAPQAPSLDAGEVLEGTVSKLGNSGIFVETQKGTGMVPLRELGLPRGADHRRAFPVGTAVRVVLLNRDASGRIAFSISRVASVEERQNYREFTTSSRQTADQPGAMGTFGQLLRQKLNLPEPAPQLKSSTDTDVSANARDPATEQAATTATAAVNSPTREHGLPVPAPQQPAPAVQARNSNPLGPTRPTPEGVIRRKRQGSDG